MPGTMQVDQVIDIHRELRLLHLVENTLEARRLYDEEQARVFYYSELLAERGATDETPGEGGDIANYRASLSAAQSSASTYAELLSNYEEDLSREGIDYRYGSDPDYRRRLAEAYGERYNGEEPPIDFLTRELNRVGTTGREINDRVVLVARSPLENPVAESSGSGILDQISNFFSRVTQSFRGENRAIPQRVNTTIGARLRSVWDNVKVTALKIWHEFMGRFTNPPQEPPVQELPQEPVQEPIRRLTHILPNLEGEIEARQPSAHAFAERPRQVGVVPEILRLPQPDTMRDGSGRRVFTDDEVFWFTSTPTGVARSARLSESDMNDLNDASTALEQRLGSPFYFQGAQRDFLDRLASASISTRDIRTEALRPHPAPEEIGASPLMADNGSQGDSPLSSSSAAQDARRSEGDGSNIGADIVNPHGYSSTGLPVDLQSTEEPVILAHFE
ncbi:MAG: hypothetical protein LBC50_01355 [Candidatus Ancillula sp.]|jgi:hypothetical protein|nr:hypothetical protein [Candidatus Ancillula sp.]